MACFERSWNSGEDTSWSVPFLTDEDVEEYQGFMLCRQNEYYKKMLEITQAAVGRMEKENILWGLPISIPVWMDWCP